MTAVSHPRKTSVYANHKLSFVGVVRSEALKFRTLTANWVMTLVISAVLIGLAFGVAAAANHYYGSNGSEQAQAVASGGATPMTMDYITNMTYALGSSGMQLACMLIASVAVVFIASEYATNQINTTLTAVPQRSMVYLAKLVVLSVYFFVLGLVVSAAAYFLGSLILDSAIKDAMTFSGGVVWNWVGTGIFSMLMAWMGLGFGALLRNNAGGIVLVVVLMFVIALILLLLPWDWASDFAKHLPMNMGGVITTYGVADDAEFGYLKAGGILALWCAVPALLGYIRFRFTNSR